MSAFQHAAAFRYIAQFSAIGEPDLDELFPAYVLRGQQGFISHGVARGGGGTTVGRDGLRSQLIRFRLMGCQCPGLRVDVRYCKKVLVAQQHGGACHVLIREGAAGTQPEDDARHAVAETKRGIAAVECLCGIDIIAMLILTVIILYCTYTGFVFVLHVRCKKDTGRGTVSKDTFFGFPAFPYGRCGVDVRAGIVGGVHKALGCAVNEGFPLAVHVDENLVAFREGSVGDGT